MIIAKPMMLSFRVKVKLGIAYLQQCKKEIIENYSK